MRPSSAEGPRAEQVRDAWGFQAAISLLLRRLGHGSGMVEVEPATSVLLSLLKEPIHDLGSLPRYLAVVARPVVYLALLVTFPSAC